MRLLVLYEELAAYFMACVAEYSESTGCDVLIVAKRPNKVAPFKIEESARTRIVYRDDLSTSELQRLCADFDPEAIFSGGWSYAPYRKISKAYRKRIPVLLGFDNWWTGNLKQRAVQLLSPFTIRRWYNCCFVPGEQQKRFALHMGFRPSRIATGAYCCDSSLYQRIYEETSAKREHAAPKRFLFLGRYEEEKGIRQLWSAFARFHEEFPDWELWCAGKGSIPPAQSAGVRHFGFVQPSEIINLVKDTSIFVLPSTFEPWGVVVHEMAIAGMPIITTPNVGAGYRFVNEESSGRIVETEVSDLYQAMKSIAGLDEAGFQEMALASHAFGNSYTTRDWTSQLLALLTDTRNDLRST
jgi:glycosyltransferase involved in cell wall biosynthesis